MWTGRGKDNIFVIRKTPTTSSDLEEGKFQSLELEAWIFNFLSSIGLNVGVVIPDKVIMNVVSERLLGSLGSCSVVWLVSPTTTAEDEAMQRRSCATGKCNSVVAAAPAAAATQCKESCLTVALRRQAISLLQPGKIVKQSQTPFHSFVVRVWGVDNHVI